MESFSDVAPSFSNGVSEQATKDAPRPSLSRSSTPESVKLNSDKAEPEKDRNTLPTVQEADSEDKHAEEVNGKPDDAEPAPSFPLLSHNRRASISSSMVDDGDGGDEEPNVARSFDRSSSPTAGAQRHGSQDTSPKPAEDGGIARMHKFSLYETSTRYYMVGMDLLDTRFRILKIDRTSGTDDLSISEDDTVYTRREMNQLLDAVDDGNKSSGGLKLRCSTWGLLGFIKFTGAYYMVLITKRSQAAMIGGHYIYQIDGTELVSLTTSTARTEKNPEEARFVSILNNIDLSRSFYFSYSYDVTRTLQRNIASDRKALIQGLTPDNRLQDYNSMFVWNHHLLKPAVASLQNAHHWCLPIIHGYVDQSALSVYGRLVYVTIIARRSRFFAGARFLKRGANDLGYVANDVETEQIVSEMLTTSFHAAGPKPYANPQYTSYVQHRGSIPLHWTQDNTGVSPKPNIELDLIDPFYSAAALHFNHLFERYGAPLYVLNLIKARERQPRESKLLKEYTNAVSYLNQFLPEDKKILYKAWDMSRASKSRDQDVIGTLEDIAEDIIPKTGFFHNGDSAETGLKMQNGIARTNCIDCLDRTNAAQFVIGKRALGHQLRALGIIDTTSIDYDTDAVNMFTDMWHDHGDTIAVQYGGSHLVNTMATYRKQNQWTGHSRDMVESFKRYYNNSFLDAQRQEAYNLFLGNYIFSPSVPMLWDLSTDYYLHHSDPREWAGSKRPNYIKWFNPEFLTEREMPPVPQPPADEVAARSVKSFDDYWLEYYRPLALSSFSKIFSFKMKSTLRHLPFRSTQSGHYDLSPFVSRNNHETESRERRANRSRKGVTIREPSDDMSEDTRSVASRSEPTPSMPLQSWVQKQQHQPHMGIMKPTPYQPFPHTPPETPTTPSKAQLNQWSIGQLVSESLSAEVSSPEAEEYERYINHPLKVPLVVTSEEEDPGCFSQRPPTNTSNLPTTSSSSAQLLATSSRTTPASPASSRRSHSRDAANADLFEYANKYRLEEADLGAQAEDNMADYIEFLNVGEEGLTVVGEDHNKKRYKRYRQWLRGKSLFKQGIEV